MLAHNAQQTSHSRTLRNPSQICNMLLRLILVLTQVTIAGSFATFPCRQSLVLELNRSRVHIKAAAFRQSERRRNSRLFNNEPLDYEDEKQEILKIKDQEFMERSKVGRGPI